MLRISSLNRHNWRIQWRISRPSWSPRLLISILPGWSSAEGAASWHKIFQIAGFVTLGLLAALEVLAYTYGSRRDSLAAVAALDFTTQREQEERQSKMEIAKANRRAARAQAEAEQLRERAAPRLLTKTEEDRMLAFLKGKPAGSFTIKFNVAAGDAENYGGQIGNLFRSAGWNIRIDAAIFDGPDTDGVWITVRDPNAPPDAAGLLQHAFAAAGIRVRGEYDPTMPDEVWLSIGSK